MRKHAVELLMACLLLVSFYILSRQAAQVSLEIGKQENGERTIVVDPGHGGKDPGMVGVGGLEEKGINLEISMILKEILEDRGYEIILTRDTDQGLYDENADNKKAQDLQRRISLIDQTDPLLAVSIHQNSYEDPSVRGPQVFYYESSVEGKKLADCIQNSMNEKLDMEKGRTPKGNATYYLLKRSSSVLVIAECGFMTNAQEAELLQTEEYQKKIAVAVADGIEEYLSDLSDS